MEIENKSDTEVYLTSERSNVSYVMDVATELYARSKFVLVMAGDSATSARTYGAIAMGAIPVFVNFKIVSKKQETTLFERPPGAEGPFQTAFFRTLNWPSFSIQYVQEMHPCPIIKVIGPYTKPCPIDAHIPLAGIIRRLRTVSASRISSMQEQLEKVRDFMLYSYDDGEVPTRSGLSAFDAVLRELAALRPYSRTCVREPVPEGFDTGIIGTD